MTFRPEASTKSTQLHVPFTGQVYVRSVTTSDDWSTADGSKYQFPSYLTTFSPASPLARMWADSFSRMAMLMGEVSLPGRLPDRSVTIAL